MSDIPKFNYGRFIILQCLNPGSGKNDYPLSGPALRTRADMGPVKFKVQMRALLNLGYVSTRGDALYRITPRGKEVLRQWWAKNYQDGKQEKLL